MIGVALCAAPAVLWRQAVGQYLLKLDDYAYVASSRDPASLRRNLLKPHNAHVVPLFRIETGLLLGGAGSLAASPGWLGGAAYGTLVLAILAAGHLVARESGSVELGLSAMAVVGLSTILGPSLLWYSASQATLSGVMILGSLIFLQSWRARGGWPRIILSFLATAAAPLIWSMGYVAGPVGAVYLWVDGRRRCRIAAGTPLIGSAMAAGFVWLSAGRELVPALAVADPHRTGLIFRGFHAIQLTAQAIAEFLVVGNLGLSMSPPPTPGQGIILCMALALIWVACRFRRRQGSTRIGPTPLEAAGAMLVVIGFMMVYTARGSYDFKDLRALGWYQSVPQLGAVLFAFGWYSGSSSLPSLQLRQPTARGLLSVAIFATALFGLQAPHAHRIIFEYDGLAAPTIVEHDGNSSSPPEDPEAIRAERFDRQQKTLTKADGIERACHESGIGREEFRQTFGLIRIPDTPDVLGSLGIDDLLIFPTDGRTTDRGRIGELLKPVLDDISGRDSP